MMDFETVELPLDNPNYLEVARNTLTECNGMLYHGPGIEAQIKLLKFLRANPETARYLLDAV